MQMCRIKKRGHGLSVCLSTVARGRLVFLASEYIDIAGCTDSPGWMVPLATSSAVSPHFFNSPLSHWWSFRE